MRGWRAEIDRYIFWALAFELALHCRRRLGFAPKQDALTLFEINDYDLTPAQVAGARRELRRRRRGPVQMAAWAAIEGSLRLGLLGSLAWCTYHHALLRRLLHLR